MVFFEAVHALINLDLGFFIGVVANNIVWLFGFAVLINQFFEKNKLFWFFWWCVELWVILDWEKLTGMAFSGTEFLMLYYISKIALLAIAEKNAGLKKYMVLLSSLQAYACIFFFTFLVGGA